MAEFFIFTSGKVLKHSYVAQADLILNTSNVIYALAHYLNL